jgi:hypothetical protein
MLAHACQQSVEAPGADSTTALHVTACHSTSRHSTPQHAMPQDATQQRTAAPTVDVCRCRKLADSKCLRQHNPYSSCIGIRHGRTHKKRTVRIKQPQGTSSAAGHTQHLSDE